MSMIELVAIIAKRAEKVISAMDTEIEAVKEEELLMAVPEIASLPDDVIRGYAVIIARARKQGWNEALQFVIGSVKELED